VNSLRTNAVVAALVLAAVVGATHFRGHATGHYLATQRYEDVYYLPPPGWLRVFSAGYHEAFADLVWMKVLIYFGEELYQRGNVENLYNYTDAILALDDNFAAVYRWVASCALYRPGDITVNDVRRAIDYLERGVRLFPENGELAWDLGATYRYELVPMLKVPEERDEARRQGLEHLRAAALRGTGPAWLALSNAAQFERLGHTEQAIRHLEEVYGATYDPAMRKEIEKRLAELHGIRYAEALRHAVDDFETARRRDFPYLSFTLYWMMGRRPPVDGIGLLARNFDPMTEKLSRDDFSP
jgi:hypothetical protein